MEQVPELVTLRGWRVPRSEAPAGPRAEEPFAPAGAVGLEGTSDSEELPA